MEQSLLFELGIVLFIGFFAAILMKKIGQSVIVGYMLAGLIIGPNVLGLVKDTSILSLLSELGIVFLMFFLGLEFTINKFKKIKNSVFFIGTYEVVLNLVLGLLLGTLIGYSIKEKLFLACIIALSSSGVVAKLLFDMKRTASKESEVLMGVMVFEDFFAIVLLGILSSFATTNSIQVDTIALSIGKALLFYTVFIIVGILLINKLSDMLLRITSQELFTSLMIGIILLMGSLAAHFNLASAAGAFLLGMVMNSYDVEERLHRTVSAFKDIFLIVFFISFGTLLNPREIPGILWMLAIIVPITVIGEIIITSSAAFLSGFSSKSSVSIASSMISRGEYSLIYASLGLMTGAISNQLYQFTGMYVFVMTLIAPIAMKNSKNIKNTLSLISPKPISYGLKLVSATLKPLLLPEDIGIKPEKSYNFMITFFIYLAILISAFILTSPIVLGALVACGIIVVILLRKLFIVKINKIESQINYIDLHEGFSFNINAIFKFISNIFTAFLLILLLGASLWNFGYIIMISLLVIFTLYIAIVLIVVYRISKSPIQQSKKSIL